MFTSLPPAAIEFMEWDWPQIEPYIHDLQSRALNDASLEEWLADWSRLSNLVHEAQQRLYVASTLDTANPETRRRYESFLEHILPAFQAGDQRLKLKLLASGLQPKNFAIPFRNLQSEVELYREENLQLLTEELMLATQYDALTGAQTVTWEGEEVTLPQLQTVYQSQDRAQRERAWRLAAERQLADRERINRLWGRFMEVRRRLADNARLLDYRAYRWRQLLRFDYTPGDCERFHQAIYEAVLPAARQVCEQRRRRLGVASLRPWDLDVDPLGSPPLRPFHDITELVERTSAIFHRLHPQLGNYFDIMRLEGLLDLDNRQGKAPGGYCTEFRVARRPFIFMNAVGVHEDVQTLLHEGGHACHVFETVHLPYHQQLHIPLEFMEVASLGMEFLASPHLEAARGGFYSRQEAARAHLEHLEHSLIFWPYMAVVDAFQHWVYQNHTQASDPQRCDAQWASLWERYMPIEDWSGLDEELRTGWQRKLHIHQVPFYYVEYGLALVGALQIWRKALHDPQGTLAAYRNALALGGTASLPQLYSAAGARLAFDTAALRQVVDWMMQEIAELQVVAGMS